MKKKTATTTATATLKVAYDPANDDEPAASPSGTLARAQPSRSNTRTQRTQELDRHQG